MEKPNQIWASDLTYISTEEGFMYVVVVMDISDYVEAKHTVTAFINAIRGLQGRAKNVIFHSDHGVQNCAKELRRKLKLLGFLQSMFRKGNCYDNAFVDFFFYIL